jgi:hypothetical protein
VNWQGSVCLQLSGSGKNNGNNNCAGRMLARRQEEGTSLLRSDARPLRNLLGRRRLVVDGDDRAGIGEVQQLDHIILF